MADRAAAIEQATKLGGVVVAPPKPSPTGFNVPPEASAVPHAPCGTPDEPY